MSCSFTIDLPDTFTFESREETFGPFNVYSLPADIIAKLALHGLKQKLADKCAKANDKDAVNEAWNNLLDGVWSARGTKAGLSETESVWLMVVTRLVRAKFMKENDVKRAKELTDEQNEMIAERAESGYTRPEIRGHADIQKMVEAELAARAARRIKIDL